MFPFKKGEVSFQSNGGEDEDSNKFEEMNLVENNNGLSGVGSSRGRGGDGGRGQGRGRRSSSSLAGSVTSNSNSNVDYEKLVTHRDVERQRRLNMSNLYSSLRSILPAQYTQGKRSISEHIEETVHYIKDMEKNVKELGDKRDELRNCDVNDSSGHDGASSSSSLLPDSVAIRQFQGGLQVEITVVYDHHLFLLSSAIQLILDQGLSVVSCTSTKISDTFLHHNLICEVMNDRNCINVSELQQRLSDLVS